MKISLLTEKSQLAEQKLKVINDMASIKAEMHSHKHSRNNWQMLNDKMNAKKEELNSLEARLINIKALLREEAIEDIKSKPEPQPDLMREIIALRNEYEAFGADGTRVASMRRMASEFAVKLTRLIKHN
jgi:chromosome segregation ATPase